MHLSAVEREYRDYAITALRRNAPADLADLIRAQWEANPAAAGGHAWVSPAWPKIAPDRCPQAPFKWDKERCSVMRAELDSYYARVYSFTRNELRYIP